MIMNCANEANMQRKRVETDIKSLLRSGVRENHSVATILTPSLKDERRQPWREQGRSSPDRERSLDRNLKKSLEMIKNLKDPRSWSKVTKKKSIGSDLGDKGHVQEFNYSKSNGKPLSIFERVLISLTTLFTYFGINNIGLQLPEHIHHTFLSKPELL